MMLLDVLALLMILVLLDDDAEVGSIEAILAVSKYQCVVRILDIRSCHLPSGESLVFCKRLRMFLVVVVVVAVVVVAWKHATPLPPQGWRGNNPSMSRPSSTTTTLAYQQHSRRKKIPARHCGSNNWKKKNHSSSLEADGSWC
jgi:hypothetical protein